MFNAAGCAATRKARTLAFGAEYVNAAGHLDLVCHFVGDSVAWVVGSDEAELNGQLLDGTPIEGDDSICLVP
jgi:hypothetical protein